MKKQHQPKAHVDSKKPVVSAMITDLDQYLANHAKAGRKIDFIDSEGNKTPYVAKGVVKSDGDNWK